MTRTRLLAAGLGIVLLITHAYFWMSSIRQGGQQDNLGSQIAAVTQTLSQIPGPAPDLEERLAQAESALATERNTFPAGTSTTETIDAILALARDSQVRISLLTTQPWTSMAVGETDYRTLPIGLEVEGMLGQVKSFIARLEAEPGEALRLRSASIAPTTDASQESADTAAMPVSASLEVVLSGYMPAGEQATDPPREEGQQ